MQCSKCGNQNNDEAKFCKQCGQNLEGRKEIEKGSKKITSVVMLVIVLGLMIGCYYGYPAIKENYEGNEPDSKYIGDNRDWVLIMDEDSSYSIDYGEYFGTYDKRSDGTYIFNDIERSSLLYGEVLDDGDIYITSDDPNWNNEVYHFKEEKESYKLLKYEEAREVLASYYSDYTLEPGGVGSQLWFHNNDVNGKDITVEMDLYNTGEAVVYEGDEEIDSYNIVPRIRAYHNQ